MSDYERSDLNYAELSVLAGVLASNGEKLDDLTLTGADFTDGRYGDIFDTMLRMRAERKPIDPTTLGHEMPQHAIFAWQVGDQVPSTTNTGYHAEIVREAAVRRRVRMAAERIAQWADKEPLDDLMQMARTEIDAAFGLQKRKVTFLKDLIYETIAQIGQPTRSTPTPWPELTKAIGGFRPGALYVIGARPGMGKTVAGLQFARALEQYGLVSFSSMEMPSRELQLRLLSQQSDIAHRMLERGEPLPDWAMERIMSTMGQFPGNVAVDDRGTMTIGDVRTQVRSVSREGKLAGVVVDYIGLLEGPSGASRIEITTEASRQLKMMARDFDVPVIVLSQLNRNAEARADKRPALADLRDSGSIEQDADVVILLHRDLNTRDSTDFEMLVAKNRHGPTGLLHFEWRGEFMKIV